MNCGISIKMESIIKLEPEMMLLSKEFHSLKKEIDNADGEDSVLACSSDETSTDTGSNRDSFTYTPVLLSGSNEDSGHEDSLDDTGNLGIEKHSNQAIRIEETSRTGDPGRDCSLNEGSGREESIKDSDEVCIVEERVCKGHWRDRNGRVGRACCTCCFMCSICGTSILRRRDFLRHVKSHMAERQADRWKLQMKRVPVDRSVRPARATETATRGSAGRMSRRPVARLQPRPTQLAINGRMSGRRPSVHLDDEGQSERVDADGDTAPQTKLVSHVAKNSLRKPCAAKERSKFAKLKDVRVIIGRLELPNEPNDCIPKACSAESADTGEKVVCDKLPQTHSQSQKAVPLSRNSPAVSNAPTNVEALQEVSKTHPLSQAQVESESLSVGNSLASEIKSNDVDAINKVSINVQPQSRAHSRARGRIVRKPHATKCTTCYMHAKKQQPQSHKQVANPRSRVQLDVGPRRSQAAESGSSRGETMKNVLSKTPPQAERSISESEPTAEGRSTNEKASEKVVSKRPDQSRVHNTSGKQTHEGQSGASTNSEIGENVLPRLVVGLESQMPVVAGKPQVDKISKDAETKEKVVSKTQSPVCNSGVTSAQRTQRARKLQSGGTSEVFATSGPPVSSAAQVQSPTLKLRMFRKTMNANVSTQGTKKLASPKSRIQSQKRTAGNQQPQQGTAEERTALSKIDEGRSEINGKVVPHSQILSQATGRGRKALKRHEDGSCSLSNAVADEKLLPKARLVSRKVVGTLQRTFQDQTSHAEECRKSRDEVSSKKQPQEDVGVLAAHKKHAGGRRIRANEQGSLKTQKEVDTKERTRPVRMKKAAKVVLKNVAVSEDVPPKTERQSHAPSVSRKRKSQSCDSSARSNVVSEASLEQADARERVFVAEESLASEGDLEKPEASGIAKKSMKTRLQAHMQADEKNGTFRCSYCKATFPDVESLRPHVESHRYWEETFHCEVCHRRFSARAHLALHMNAHKQEKPFACDRCERRFALRSHLALHRRSHEKPFGCGACGERFARVNLLRAHVRSHTLGDAGRKRKKVMQ